MARVRSGQAAAWPLSSDRSARRGSGVKHDFACTFTRQFPPPLVARRSQSCLRLEGRARTLSGPSPALSPARTPAPSARREDLLIRGSGHSVQNRPLRSVCWADIQRCSHKTGVVQRLGNSIGYSRCARGIGPDRPSFRPGVSRVGADRASVMRCRRSLLLLLSPLLSAAGPVPHLRGLLGAVTEPCPTQAPPPNPTAAEPDGRRVLSRVGAANHEVTLKAPSTGSG